jgi:spermidine synthase
VFGAIVGAILGGFVLLPLLGSRGSLVAASALAVLSSTLLAASQWRSRPNFAGFMLITGPVLFVMCALNTADPFAIVAHTLHRGERVVWRQEGVQTTVAVHDRDTRSGNLRVLYLDGMHQSDDMPSTAFVHHRIGALPVMLHPSARKALVVGLGGGATAGAVARFPGLEVDVVELSGDVVEAARYFRHINFNLFERPNVHLRVDDGRNFLLTTRERYDVITADIILPRHAGAGALYAKEYFRLVRAALAENGLVLQWNGAETMTPYKMIMRTFIDVFPNTTLWGDGSLMLGSVKPFEFSRRGYEQRRADPRFRELFDWDLEMIRKNYIAGPEDLGRWVGEGPLLSDDKPLIEYFLTLPKDDPPVDLRGLSARFDDVLRP